MTYFLDIFLWQCESFTTSDSLTYFTKSIYFEFPDYQGLRLLVERTVLYFCILDRSLLLSHQPCFETGLISIPYLFVFIRSWSSIRNLSLTRKNGFEEYDQFQINSKHFGYTVDYMGQRQLPLSTLFCPMSNNIVESNQNYHFILRYIHFSEDLNTTNFREQGKHSKIPAFSC